MIFWMLLWTLPQHSGLFTNLSYCRPINFHCLLLPCRNAIQTGEISAEADMPPVTAVQ